MWYVFFKNILNINVYSKSLKSNLYKLGQEHCPISVLNLLCLGIKHVMPFHLFHPIPLFYCTFSLHFPLYDGSHAGLAGERNYYSTAVMSGRTSLVNNKLFVEKIKTYQQIAVLKTFSTVWD